MNCTIKANNIIYKKEVMKEIREKIGSRLIFTFSRGKEKLWADFLL